MKAHSSCGGKIENRVCTKCGKTWSRLGYLTASDVVERQGRFDEKAYKDRIRKLKDIQR